MPDKSIISDHSVNKEIVLAWWNTSMTPPATYAKSRSEKDKEFAVDFILKMRDEINFDVLGLCEVDDSDIDAISKKIGANFSVENDTGKIVNLKFDLAIFFNNQKLELVGKSRLFDRKNGEALKAGARFSFKEKATNETIHIVLSHWPMHKECAHDMKKTELACCINSEIRRLKECDQNEQIPFVILMGDYNDEPFSTSLSYHLGSTRDRGFLEKNPEIIYNPFWRHLGEHKPHNYCKNESIYCGTHFYKKGRCSRWFTFDQIMFSSAFINADRNLILAENRTSIIHTDEIIGKITGKGVFDHLPVTSTVLLRK